MRHVFENIDFTVVGHFQTILEARGIPTEIRNIGTTGLAGSIPHTQVYPELWVVRNEHEEVAREIIREYREKDESAPKAPDWTCPKCGERVEGVFGECWNCGTGVPA